MLRSCWSLGLAWGSPGCSHAWSSECEGNVERDSVLRVVLPARPAPRPTAASTTCGGHCLCRFDLARDVRQVSKGAGAHGPPLLRHSRLTVITQTHARDDKPDSHSRLRHSDLCTLPSVGIGCVAAGGGAAGGEAHGPRTAAKVLDNSGQHRHARLDDATWRAARRQATAVGLRVNGGEVYVCTGGLTRAHAQRRVRAWWAWSWGLRLAVRLASRVGMRVSKE